jgi:hypothetical protein
MLYREIIAVCSQLHSKHINKYSVCGQNVECVNVTPDGTCSYHKGLKMLNKYQTNKFLLTVLTGLSLK